MAAGQPPDADLDSAEDDDRHSPRPPSRRRRSPPRSLRSTPDGPMSHGSIGRTRPRSTRRRGSHPHASSPPPRRGGQRRASHRGHSHDARSGRARPGRRARRGADDGRGGRAVADRRDPAAGRDGDRAAGPDLCRRCVTRRWRGRLTDASGGRVRRRGLRSVDRAEPDSEDQPVAIAGSIGEPGCGAAATATSR